MLLVALARMLLVLKEKDREESYKIDSERYSCGRDRIS